MGFGGLYMHDQIRFAVSVFGEVIMNRRIGLPTESSKQLQMHQQLMYAIF